MPAMGTSIVEGTIIAWSKGVGDRVEAGEAICEISTDKIDSECPAPAAGVVAAILADVGDTIDVGTVIARLAVDGGPAVDPPSAAREPNRPPFAASSSDRNGHPRTARDSPVVRRIASAHGIDLSRVSGSGRGGRVTKKDVLAHVDTMQISEPLIHSDSPYRPDPPPREAAGPVITDLGGTRESLSRMREQIGISMRRSQDTAATCHTYVECDMSRVETRRRELRLTALPFVARAAIDTLRDFPNLNSTLEGTTITRYSRVHLGVAVSLGAEGLIVPVIHDAQELSPEGLGARIKEVARRARSRQLTPDDVHGATFTITNPGAAGAVFATPVINLPQVAILDLEAIVRRPVVVSDADGNESIAIRPMVNLILGWDHRALDGMYAAEFLTALRKRVEFV
jgi:pyruvate/2-oxoglutarate dehydrogenase complex dihydrolipoamide acyltransferase (E2) component